MSTHEELINLTLVEAVDLKSLQFLLCTQILTHLKALGKETEASDMLETLETMLAVDDIPDRLLDQASHFLHLIQLIGEIGNFLLFEVLDGPKEFIRGKITKI